MITREDGEHILGLIIDLEAASKVAATATLDWSNVRAILTRVHTPGRDEVVHILYKNVLSATDRRDKAWNKIVDFLREGYS